MALFSAQELLRRHRIDYVATRSGKYTTGCPHCNEGGYLNVELKTDRVVWYCHHCDEGGSELFEQTERKSDLGPIKAVFDYCDENGKRLFQVVRFEPVNAPKIMRQRTDPDQEKWSIKGVRIVPYRLPELIEAVALSHTVFIVEGEKKVEALRERGAVATCNPMGAGKWRAEFSRFLDDADVVIIPDNDPQGHDHALKVARSLRGHAERIRVLDLAAIWPEIEASDDIYDWLADGHEIAELWARVEQLGDWQDEQANGNGGAHEAAAIEPEPEPMPEPRRATPYNPPDPATIPKRAWLYGGHYIRQTASATVAPGGYGKTSLQLYEALNMVGAGLAVWYLSGEDPKVELDRRIAAHCEKHGFDLMHAAGRLFVDDRSTFPLTIATVTRAGVLKFDDNSLAEFENAIASDRIDAVIIDPFISFHTVPENDNGSVDAVVKRLALIAVRTDAAIELSHHVRKTFGLRELTIEDARGGSAIVNAVRSGRVINRMSTSEAEQANVPQDKRHFFIRLDLGKRNMAPPQKATWFNLENVELANGDNVQTLVSWQFPGETDAANSEIADMVRGLLSRQPYRADTRSDKWLGIHIAQRLGLNINVTADIKKIQRIIGDLIKRKIVKKEEKRDEDTRKKAMFYVAGEADNVVRLFPDQNGDD